MSAMMTGCLTRVRDRGPLVNAREHDAGGKLVGIDPSAAFIEAARSQNADPRVTIELGDAQNLPYADASFDRCLALLIVNFIPDAPKAAKECAA